MSKIVKKHSHKSIITIKYYETEGGKIMCNSGSGAAIVLVLFILLIIILGAYI